MKKSNKVQPLISVIVPNYNHARYLDQRMQSILNQTYQYFEVIFLDDCSTDDSLNIIEKYKTDQRISHVVVNERNSGNTFLQWDKGIHLAKGDLIWIAESDDYCEPDLLEELVIAYYSRRNTVLAYSTLTLVDESGNVIERKPSFNNQYYTSSQFIRRYLSLANFIRNASCALFSRTAALNVSSDYLHYVGAGDYQFWVEIANQGRIAIVNKGLSYFRRHSGVVTEKRDSDGTNFIAEKDILNKILVTSRIGFLRNHFIHAYHCRRVRQTEYDSEQIKKQLFSLWEVDNYTGLLSRLILKITDVVRNRYNIYL